MAVDLVGLFLHFAMISLLAIGGAITTAPEMHRFLVADHGWLSDTQFTTSIAIAQAAPGPNVLFVAVLGWNVAGAAGALATMTGTLLPSTVLTLTATRWASANRDSRVVRAFTVGMTPLTLGLIVATGWLLAAPYATMPGRMPSTLALMALTVALVLRTKIPLVWLVLGGGVLGALGVV
ncbi:chromate transporter [Paucibacter sp. R3-3]|uniref:Chromate transporter n=1 Tax=Roseateles agri TaxID=3098619 RepID=A0ABU5DKL6_9BURK|nr:chromate transporter [Paucibacter sp. R3-3]MDY0746296.1 chromate transporter [Paucibacter sp. R3-3]